MKKKLFFLNLFIILAIFFNLIKSAENIFYWISYPVDFLFSKVQQKFLSAGISADSFDKILETIESSPIRVVDTMEIKLSIPYGIIMFDDLTSFTVAANKKPKLNSLVIDENANLLGFVCGVFSNRVEVKKLGYGKNEFFGEIEGLDVLIKESEGNILVELPENFTFESTQVYINIPKYLLSVSESSTLMTGEFVSQYYANFFLFRSKKASNPVVYFLEE